MATEYDAIEDAIEDALEGTGTPFAHVEAYGAQLSDAELAEELQKLVSRGPSALIVFDGGDTNGGEAGVLEETARFTVLVMAPGRSRQAALRGDKKSAGVYELIQWCRLKLHTGLVLSGATNPVVYRGSRRLALPGDRLTVAAYACLFETPLYYKDGPG